jgi:hypothetical protein
MDWKAFGIAVGAVVIGIVAYEVISGIVGDK